MAKIIILRGNSGSGKSTVATRLQKSLGRGTLLLGQDCIRREMLWVRDEPHNQAIDLLLHLAEYGRHHCETVILEGILYTNIYQDLFAGIKRLYENQIHAYYFDLPFEETLRRHKQKSVSHEFGETEMKRWWREKDYLPGITEKIISMELSCEETVAMILGDIGQTQ